MSNKTTLLSIYKHFNNDEHKFTYGTLKIDHNKMKIKKKFYKFKNSYSFNTRFLPGSYIYWASRTNQLTHSNRTDISSRYKHKNTHEIVEIYNKLDKNVLSILPNKFASSLHLLNREVLQSLQLK